MPGPGSVNNNAAEAARRAEAARKAAERAREAERKAEAARKKAEQKDDKKALTQAKKKEQKAEEKLVRRAADAEDKIRDANAAAEASGAKKPFTQREISETQLKTSEVRDAVEGSNAATRRELTTRLGVKNTDDPEILGAELRGQREFQNLQADPKSARALQDLDVRNAEDLRSLGDRIASEATGGRPGVEPIDLSGVTDKGALADVIKGSGRAIGGSTGELIAKPEFADGVAGGQSIAEAARKSGLADDPKKPEGLGRKEGREFANDTADRAEKKLGKPLSEVSPAEADQALKEAAIKEAKERKLPKEQIRALEGRGSHDSKAKEFANAYADEAKRTLSDRLGKNSDVVLTGAGGRAVQESVSGEVERATEGAWGKKVGDKAGEIAGEGATYKASPAKQRELATERINSYREQLHKLDGLTIGGDRTGKDFARKELAEQLNSEVKNLPESERVKFLEENREVISDVSAGANGEPDEDIRKSILRDLGETADLAGLEGAKVIGQEFAKNVTTDNNDVDDSDQLGGALKSIVNEGVGIGFASQVISALEGKDGLSEARGDIIKATREGITEFRKDFESAQKEYARVDGALKRYLAGFGPAMSPEQQEKAIEAFKDRPENKKIYDKYEELQNNGGAALEGLDALNQDKSLGKDMTNATTKALSHSPEFMQSPEGQRAVEGALRGRARDPKETSFLDNVKTWAKDLGEIENYGEKAKVLLDSVNQAIVSSIGNRVINDAATGSSDTKELLKGLRNSSDLLGLDEKKLGKSTNALQDILDAKTPAQRNDAISALKKAAATDASETGSSSGSKVLGALGVVFSAVNVGLTIKGGFDNKKLSQQIQASGDALGVGAKAASWGLGALSSSVGGLKGAEAASKVFGAGAERLGIIGAVASGVGAVEAFKKGDTAKGVIGVANTVGSVLLQVPNPWVKLAGAVVVAGSAIAGIIAGQKDPLEEHYKKQGQEQAGLETFLKAGGFSPEASKQFAKHGGFGVDNNLGSFVTQIAPHFKKSPKEMFEYLNKNPDKIEGFASAAFGLQDRKEGQNSEAPDYVNVQKNGYEYNDQEYNGAGPIPNGDGEQYKIGKDGKLLRPAADSRRSSQSEGSYASLTDAAARLKSEGGVPKSWGVYVPKDDLRDFRQSGSYSGY